MSECNNRIIVPDLDSVSRECKSAIFCKSKVQSEGTFIVETTGSIPRCLENDPRRVWLSVDVKESEKFANLDDLLDASGFDGVVDDRCSGKKNCKVFIKVNFAPTTQKEFKGYTDPELVEHVVKRIESKGHSVTIFETETKLADLSPVFLPEVLAYRLDPPYTRAVRNLSISERQRIEWKDGALEVSKLLVDADMIINFGKIKSLSEFYLSVALKNMYGALPNRDKYHEFHWQNSGFSVEDATVVSNHATGVDFNIMDGIVTEDGGKTSSMHLDVDKNHFNAGILMAGRDPLTIDKLVSLKIGFDQNKPSVTRKEVEFRGDFDLIKNPQLVEIVGKKDITSDEKFSPFKDIITGKKWEKPSEFAHIALNTFQFIIPRTFGVPDRIMKVAMCAVSPNYTIMTDEEKNRACQIKNMLPPPLTLDWT